jgi:hydroxymethylglutaryl-CoA lyase
MYTSPQIFDQTFRDGLMDRPVVDLEIKLKIIAMMIDCGIKHFEVVRFPLDGSYSQFDHGLELLERIQFFRQNACIAVFAMGTPGIEEALKYSRYYDQLHVPCFVSEEYARYAFGEGNWDRSLVSIKSTMQDCRKSNVELTVGLGTSFGCPISQSYHLDDTIDKISDLLSVGIECIMLGDTAGTATPSLVSQTLAAIRELSGLRVTRVHFHNTFGRALLNTWVACLEGVDGIDTSLMGLGGEGHPYFFCANDVNNGNCATEEILPLLIQREGEKANGILPAAARRLFKACRILGNELHCPPPGRACYADLVKIEEEHDEVSQGTNRH